MKTIIIPTDFSETADNALNYSIELAKITGAKVVLLHAYHFPVSSDDMSFQEDVEADFEKTNRQTMEMLRDKALAKDPGVEIEIFLKLGLAGDIIVDVAEEKKADLIVIGISETGVFGETVFGSNAVETIKDSAIPVLIVPLKAKFKVPTKFLFATDFMELKSDEPLNVLVDFVNYFKAHVYIVNIVKEDEKTPSRKVAAIINVKRILKRVVHSFHFPVNDSVVDGINRFVGESGSEIVAMIPRKHNIFYRLFNLSITKKMVFHTNVPLLALPENVINEFKLENIVNKEAVVRNMELEFSSFYLGLKDF
ncbi:MAG: universal stress protein [Bacteroidia bacterium]